jgi:hypothetical protein
MIGLICLLSTTEASFSLINVTSGIYAGFTVTAPSGTVSVEDQAEWILDGTTALLPDFAEIYFDSTVGGLDLLADAGMDTAINMVVNDTTVATTTVQTPTLIKVAYTGS